MKFVTFNNGYKMPQLGLGTFLVESGEVAYNTVKYALEVGYRHIDTAQMYKNEASVGRAIKDSKIPRKDIYITTKQGRTGDIHYMEEQLNKSLEALQTDYIDLYLIHWPNQDKKINQATWAFFEKAYKEGKIKAIGISNFQIHMINDLLETATVVPAVNQVELHPGLSQVSLKKYLDEKGIQTESYGPLMRGKVFEGRFKEALEPIAKSYDKSIAQIIIAWGLTRGLMMIPKSVTPSRIKDNFEAQFIKLSDEDMKKIDALSFGERVYTDPDNSLWGAYVENK
ncbi:aldo/keto reductase [Mycoplasmatota bacterium]|nr:aldo/keto reductase [Mycoplasmatota bacterium]